MRELFYILLAGVFTFFVCVMAGRLLLAGFAAKLYRQEEIFLSFVAGSALLSTLVFLLSAVHLAYKSAFIVTGAVIICAAVWRGKPAAKRFEPLSLAWRLLFEISYVGFGVLYLASAAGPETSPDGTAYHLWVVTRYYDAHSLQRITTSMYANLSQGVEMLFLFAFPFGGMPATAVVHLLFLLMLPFGILCFSRRFNRPHAGILAAMMVFCAPIVGRTGTVAYVDVAAACVVFGGFYLITIWRADPGMALLLPAGIVCGFAYCCKYTAFPILIYALVVVLWNARGPRLKQAAVLSACMLATMAPWLLKNWIYVDNPFAPFLNQLFPNQYFYAGVESNYVSGLSHMNDVKYSEIPLEVTIRGVRLTGLIGPIFLLVPLGLLAARNRIGRHLLGAAALMLAPYFLNIGARFLIPALPFLALSFGFALSYDWLVLIALGVATISCCPQVVNRYCAPYAWRISEFDYKSALHLRPDVETIRQKLGQSYDMGLVLDQMVPASEPVYSLGSLQRSYHKRNVIEGYESAFGVKMFETLAVAMQSDMQYRWKVRLGFPEVSARYLRVRPAASSVTGKWGIGELRVFSPQGELQRSPDWRLAACPNVADVQDAFDGNPVTQWSTREPYSSRDFVSVDLRSSQEVSGIVLDCNAESAGIPVAVEVRGETGPWRRVNSTAETIETKSPPNLRWLAAQTLKSRGIRWLLVGENEWSARDFFLRRDEWDLSLRVRLGEYRLFSIQ